MQNLVVRSTVVHTARLCLRPFGADDAVMLLAYQHANRKHLQPWEPLRDERFYSVEIQQQRVAAMVAAMAAETALHLMIIFDGRMVGECHFRNIVQGPFQACYLGYSLAEKMQGFGFMSEALKAALVLVFDKYKLNRVMANYQPENVRSAVLLSRLGFEIEGQARRYLKINGEWVDHILTAKLRD